MKSHNHEGLKFLRSVKVKVSLQARLISMLVVTLLLSSVHAQSSKPPIGTAVEVVQVLELPLAINEAVLLKTQQGYALTCRVSNSSESRLIELRYSLAIIDSTNTLKAVVTNTERINIGPFLTKQFSFKSPIRLKPVSGQRPVLLVEGVESSDYAWELVKPKAVLTAYVAGDYSITSPAVMRLPKQVDSPIRRVVP